MEEYLLNTLHTKIQCRLPTNPRVSVRSDGLRKRAEGPTRCASSL